MTGLPSDRRVIGPTGTRRAHLDPRPGGPGAIGPTGTRLPDGPQET